MSTNLSHSMEAHSLALRVIAPIFKAVLSKSPDSGARVYLAAGLTGKEGHVSNHESPGSPHVMVVDLTNTMLRESS